LFSAGSKQNKLEAIEKDLIKFQVAVDFNLITKLHNILQIVKTIILQTALKSDKVLKEFVDNPINKRSLKSSTLQLAAKKLALSPPSSNFLSKLNVYILAQYIIYKDTMIYTNLVLQFNTNITCLYSLKMSNVIASSIY